MKVTLAVIFFAAFFANSLALPARSDDKDTEFVEIVPLGGSPIVDTGYLGGGFTNPFGGLFENLERTLTRMRHQMNQLLNGFGSRLNDTTSVEDAFPSVLKFPSFPDLEGKGNTTSVTKVIDGHKVVINETTYNKQGPNGGAFFKIRVIDVKPDGSEITTENDSEAITSSPRDVEPLDEKNSAENEISKSNDIEDHQRYEVIKSFDEVDHKSTTPSYGSKFHNNWQKITPINDEIQNFIEYTEPPRDLSKDTLVNKYMADAGAPIDPDAEVFDSTRYGQGTYPKYNQGTYSRYQSAPYSGPGYRQGINPSYGMNPFYDQSFHPRYPNINRPYASRYPPASYSQYGQQVYPSYQQRSPSYGKYYSQYMNPR